MMFMVIGSFLFLVVMVRFLGWMLIVIELLVFVRCLCVIG